MTAPGGVRAPGAERAALIVREMDASSRARWDAFVMSNAEATFFHRAGWHTLVQDVFRHRCWFLYAERDGVIEGVLPLAQVKSRLFGHALVSLPFCVYGGVAASTSAAADALIAEAEVLAQRLRVEHLELRHVAATKPDWPRQQLYVTFRKPILPDVDENLKAIPRKQRAMVRKGIKAGLLSRMDDAPDRFFDLYADNVHRHGTPALPKKYFLRLQDVFGKDCELMTVTDTQGRAVSSVMSFRFRNEILPYYAGDATIARELAGNDFKYWELMRRACEQGVEVFDYGRSKRGTGSFDFKKNWGFEPTPLNYEYRLYRRDDLPQNNPMNPKYRAFISLWRKLPIAVANRLGPHIVRNLG